MGGDAREAATPSAVPAVASSGTISRPPSASFQSGRRSTAWRRCIEMVTAKVQRRQRKQPGQQQDGSTREHPGSGQRHAPSEDCGQQQQQQQQKPQQNGREPPLEAKGAA